MKKRFLLLLPVLLIGIIAFVVSCVRNQDVYWDSPDLKSQRPLTVSDAQSWFEKEYRDDITVVRSVQNGSSTRMVSYAAGVFAGSPDWATARPFRKNSNSLIVTLDYLNPKTNYRGFRDIIIVRNHKTKSFNAFVQLQLFDTTHLNDQKRIKGPREHIREYSDPATFTGKVYKYSINNEFIRGAIYKNGKLVARVFPKNKISSFFNSPSSSTAKKSYVPYNGGANLGRAPGTDVSKAVKIHSRSVVASYEEPPVRMSYSGGDSTDTDEYDTHDPDSNGETVVVTAVGTGTQPDTDTCDPLWGDTCDGSGDDGGGDPYPTDPNDSGGGGGGTSGGGSPQTVINLIQDPCKKSALLSITNDKIKNTITQFYNDYLVPNNTGFQILIRDGAVDGGGQAVTNPVLYAPTGSWQITLSNAPAYQGSVMSKEAWGAVIAHEILHIVIGSSASAKPTDDNYVHHSNMFYNYTNTIKNLLKDAFSMPESDATKMALHGLADLWTHPSFDSLSNSLYGVTRAQINQTGANYSSGGSNLGQRCPN